MTPSNRLLIEFGARIREIRKRKGLSQEDLSFAANLDRTYISQVECGRRNISLRNIQAVAEALSVSVRDIFVSDNQHDQKNNPVGLSYRMNNSFSASCGFEVSSKDLLFSIMRTGEQLNSLPFILYQSIDLKTLSSIVGALFASQLAERVDAIVNPIEKGHPDIIPKSGRGATEAQLRNYPTGLEVKATVGNVRKGSNLTPGSPRITNLTGITWQAHHREVESLLGLVIDFAGAPVNGLYYPVITGIFYTDELVVDDWGKISGTTGRNTKVTGMKTCGKNKMGRGWVLLLDKQEYLTSYSKLLKFKEG